MHTANSIANADPIQFPVVIFGMICSIVVYTYVSCMMCHAMYRILSIIITSSDPHHDIYRFVTGKSSGILSGISSGIRSGILSGISSGILPGISSGILSGH